MNIIKSSTKNILRQTTDPTLALHVGPLSEDCKIGDMTMASEP